MTPSSMPPTVVADIRWLEQRIDFLLYRPHARECVLLPGPRRLCRPTPTVDTRLTCVRVSQLRCRLDRRNVRKV